MDTGRPIAFGSLLRRHRLAAGLTQEELAARAQVSRRSIGDMERGVGHRPRRDTVALLAAALALGPPERAAFAEAARHAGAVTPAPGVPAGGAEPPFVGRARELALLERHLGGEGPPLLLLAGEPGIGKTRLLRAAASRGAGHGLCVLEGGCQRSGGHEPYAPLLGALQRHLQGQRATRLRAELAGCAWLVRLLPELATWPIEPLPAWTLPPAQERRLMVEAVIRFLTNAAGPMGTLLVLDDLQWAGPDALALLGMLARAAREIPLRVVGAYRDTEAPPEATLSAALTDLAHAGLAARRLLGPLAPEEAARLLDVLLEDMDPGSLEGRIALRERTLQRAGGVPFFVVSCALALRPDGPDPPTATAVPWHVGHSVRQRVAVLPATAREVLNTAAILGRVAMPGMLAVVTAQPVEDVLGALDAAGQARLLVEERDAYQFAHDVIREVIEADLGTVRRAVLHRRVAAALEQQPGERPIEAIAYHYARSDAHDRAALYLEQSGDRAARRHAHAAAHDYYQEATDRLDRLGRQEEIARVCEKLGVVLKTLGRYDQALLTLERAVAIHRAGRDLEAEGRATATIGQVHFDAGTWEAGIARVRSLLASLEARGPSPALAALYVALIPLFAPTGRYREYLAAAERASALARSLEDGWLLADSETWRGVALAELDRPMDARPVLEGAVPLAETARHPRSLGRALAFLGRTYLADGAFARARLMLAQALETAERLGDPQFIGWTTCRLADVHVLMGTWPEARTLYERANALFRDLGGATRFSSVPLVGLGALSLREGNLEDASRYLEEGAAMAARARHLGALRAAQQILSERDLLDGRPRDALARLQALRTDLDLEDSVLTKPMPALALVHLALGKLAEAEALVSAGVARARDRCNRVDLADWLRLQALVWTSQGRYPDARGALDEALVLARAMPYPYAEGRLLHAYGILHAGWGESEPALAQLAAALAIFKRLGAGQDSERVEQEIGALQRLSPA